MCVYIYVLYTYTYVYNTYIIEQKGSTAMPTQKSKYWGNKSAGRENVFDIQYFPNLSPDKTSCWGNTFYIKSKTGTRSSYTE